MKRKVPYLIAYRGASETPRYGRRRRARDRKVESFFRLLCPPVSVLLVCWWDLVFRFFFSLRALKNTSVTSRVLRLFRFRRICGGRGLAFQSALGGDKDMILKGFHPYWMRDEGGFERLSSTVTSLWRRRQGCFLRH